MSDPAIEAAQRAWDAIPERSYKTRTDVMEAAAREALKPIRRAHFAHHVPVDNWTCCPHCAVTWPCDTAKLAYSTEELE